MILKEITNVSLSVQCEYQEIINYFCYYLKITKLSAKKSSYKTNSYLRNSNRITSCYQFFIGRFTHRFTCLKVKCTGKLLFCYAYMIFFNVIVLSYGMETAFFRFYHKGDSSNTELTEQNKKEVVSTATVSIFWSTILFLCITLLFQKTSCWIIKC